MATIKEDYVSFETAKLLKEKGFCGPCFAYYSEYIDNWKTFKIWIKYPKTYDTVRNNGYVLVPTLQMAMKWLREVHNLVIEPYRTACGYLYTISNIPYGSTKYDNSEAYNGDDEYSGQWTTWEKACEAAIKYCIENLI